MVGFHTTQYISMHIFLDAMKSLNLFEANCTTRTQYILGNFTSFNLSRIGDGRVRMSTCWVIPLKFPICRTDHLD